MKKWLLAVLFGLVLTLAACGGGGDEDTEEPADNNDAATEENDAAEDEGATEEGAADEGTADEGATEEGATVDTAAAEEIYATNCTACHGSDLSGGVGPDLTKIGSSYSADEIADIIENGKGSMPAQNVSGEDLENLSNWLAQKQ